MQPVRPPLVSQNGEDFLLLAAFSDQVRGFFIDVGAFDGVHLSNTWALEQVGWFGYCLEPSPEMFVHLAANRPGSICLPVAAGRETGRTELLTDPTMLLSSIADDGRTVRSAYEKAASYRGLTDETFHTHTVDVVPLDDLLRKHAPPPQVDVVSIDVEGAEFDVLDGFDLDHHRPRVLVIEANDQDSRDAQVRRCEAAGYEAVRRLGNNLFFAFEDHLKERLATTRMNCHFPRNMHPRGVNYTHPDLREDRILLRGTQYDWEELHFRVHRDRVEHAPPAQTTSAPITTDNS